MFFTYHAAATAAKSLQSCPTLCDPRDGSPLGSSVLGILQARILEWVAMSFSNTWKWKVKVKSLSCVRLLATPWTAAYQALHPWNFPGKSAGVGCHCLLRNSRLDEAQAGIKIVRRNVNNLRYVDDRRRQWHPTLVLLPGKSHGWRSLVGCSPCGR